MTLTTDMITSWRPCPDWPPERVREVCAPLGETFTALDLLRLDTVPPADHLWVVLRREVLADRTLRLFACRCARRALDRERAAGREPDARSWAAVEVAERFARGDAEAGELSAAADADAADAAWAAAWAAADAAADAAWAAARTAAWAAARTAARAADAAWAAADAAADADAADADAEREAQVRDLIDLLSEAA